MTEQEYLDYLFKQTANQSQHYGGISMSDNNKSKENKKFKLAEKILRDNICKYCMDETLQSLVNTPKRQVIKAMIEFAEKANNE